MMNVTKEGYAIMMFSVFIDIQRLMGCLLFVKKDMTKSPYCDLFDPWHWSDINDTFTRCVSLLNGQLNSENLCIMYNVSTIT